MIHSLADATGADCFGGNTGPAIRPMIRPQVNLNLSTAADQRMIVTNP
jgi:hypothetical protein